MKFIIKIKAKYGVAKKSAYFSKNETEMNKWPQQFGNYL